MAILDEKGLSGWVKRFLDLVFIGGIGIFIFLPLLLKWYFENIYRINGENYNFLLVFLYITGFACLVIVNELRRIFKAINKGNPFIMGNVHSLKRISFASFFISLAYVVKIICFNSFLTIIIAMVFIIAGLFCIILAEVFHQAVIVKEENDLTI
ncbi:MAG: DUF2975 domain-containing protein [Clostridiales bacterium]|jgi:hypothetical protein|nr:DUF2975 domain-containing protein [Eubacteriales bacterium]MDH7565615.1 DUF2975 domain-containing protein [Clostridiales bacterium]